MVVPSPLQERETTGRVVFQNKETSAPSHGKTHIWVMICFNPIHILIGRLIEKIRGNFTPVPFLYEATCITEVTTAC